MGAEPWFYFVDYQVDINKALHELRQGEFKAGRYNPAESFPKYPVNPSQGSGCKHKSIEEAKTDADAAGTRSILDIERVADNPDFGAVAPLEQERLVELFGTDKPTRAMIASNFDLFDDIERGQGIYIIAYESEKASKIFFAGYSYD